MTAFKSDALKTSYTPWNYSTAPKWALRKSFWLSFFHIFVIVLKPFLKIKSEFEVWWAFNLSIHNVCWRSQMFCVRRRVFFCWSIDLDSDSTSVSINCRSLDKSLNLWASGSSSFDGSFTSELLDKGHNEKIKPSSPLFKRNYLLKYFYLVQKGH